MHAHAAAYIRMRCIANPFVLLQFVQIGVLRACKDARTPLYAVLIANISNLLMDVLFVFGFNMGAGGAALATSLSQMLSCSILFGVLRQRCARCPLLCHSYLRIKHHAAGCTASHIPAADPSPARYQTGLRG